MTILRPVTQIAPASTDVLEDTSLPLSFVITPFGPRPELSSPAHQNGTPREASSTASPPPTQSLPVPATLVAKCTHCGSPANPCTPCVDVRSQQYLCGLCGKTYGADADSQHRARRRADWNGSGTTGGDPAAAEDADILMREAYHQRRRRVMGMERAGGDGGLRGWRQSYLNGEVDNDGTGGSGGGVGMDPATRRHSYELSLPVVPTIGRDDVGVDGITPDSASSPLEAVPPYAVPARLCPPILLFLIDGTSYDQAYYDAVCQCLYRAIEDAPDYARVGLFLATENGSMSVFDLSGSVPHLKHCRVPVEGGDNYDGADANNLVPLVDVADLHDVIVPLCSYHKSHVEAAIRALGDMTTVIGGACHHDGGHQSQIRNNGRNGMYLGASLEAILDYLGDSRAFHPDLLEKTERDGRPITARMMEDWAINIGNGHDFIGNEDGNENTGTFRYAGGKVMCFLSGAPSEIDSQIMDSAGTIGTGGFGGSCAEIGRRFATGSAVRDEYQADQNKDYEAGNDEFDPEAGRLNLTNGIQLNLHSDLTKKSTNGDAQRRQRKKSKTMRDAGFYYNGVGIRCAEAALGVEVFALLSKQGASSGFGIAHLRLLSDRSGGSGPLLVDIGNFNTFSLSEQGGWDNSVGGTVRGLLREVAARSPWGRPVAFGTLLRLRMTPSMSIDTSLVEQMHEAQQKEADGFVDPALATLFKNNGFFGSLSPGNEKDLVIAGSCDGLATFMFDADIVSKGGKVSGKIYVEDRGEIDLPPCIQSCFAYTSIVPSGDEWLTVRRLRVLSTNMKISEETEDVLASVDAEALAVVLFHKLSLSAMQDGLEEAHHVAQDWLLSTLLCAYRSAEAYHERIKIEKEHGITRSRKCFYPSERLVGHKAGELTDREILLAQGHDRLSSLPLLVFSLLQCDALRPNDVESSFYPTHDARTAAAANMANMTPGALARSIAPRLEVWSEDSSDKSKEPLVENLNMNMEAVRLAHADLNDDAQGTAIVPILLLDSPRQIMVCSCSDIVESIDGSGVARGNTPGKKKIGNAFRQTVEETIQSYRVPPPVLCCLGDSNSTGADPGLLVNEAVLHLQDALIEDSLTSLSKENFDRWCTEVASLLHSEICTAE